MAVDIKSSIRTPSTHLVYCLFYSIDEILQKKIAFHRREAIFPFLFSFGVNLTRHGKPCLFDFELKIEKSSIIFLYNEVIP